MSPSQPSKQPRTARAILLDHLRKYPALATSMRLIEQQIEAIEAVAAAPDPVASPAEWVARLSEDSEGHGMALRAMGEAITEIGLRDISGSLTDEDIAASVFLARNVLHWAYGTEWTPEDWSAAKSHAASPRPPKADPVATAPCEHVWTASTTHQQAPGIPGSVCAKCGAAPDPVAPLDAVKLADALEAEGFVRGVAARYGTFNRPYWEQSAAAILKRLEGATDGND